MCGNRRDQELPIPAQLDPRSRRRDLPSHIGGLVFVTACRQASGLARRVNTSHLHGDCGDSGQTQQQNHHQRGDRQRRLDGT